jgi:hypothetical protein
VISILNKYYKFILKSFVLIFCLIIIDTLTGNLLRHFYFKQIAGENYRTSYSIDSTNAEILVFGSSRAVHHYVPEVFESKFKLSFYNLGREGNFILYNYAIFNTILKRYNPKIIIFDLNPNELILDTNSYARLSALLPYYKDHPEIRNIINLRSPYEKIKLFSAIYPFNSNLFTIAFGNLGITKKTKADNKGYIPLHTSHVNQKLYKMQYPKGIYDRNKINALKDIIRLCKINKINLYFVFSTIYANVDENNVADSIVNIIKSSNIEVFDYINDKSFIENSLLFQDQLHLNEDGSKIFSEMVANQIYSKIIMKN